MEVSFQINYPTFHRHNCYFKSGSDVDVFLKLVRHTQSKLSWAPFQALNTVKYCPRPSINYTISIVCVNSSCCNRGDCLPYLPLSYLTTRIFCSGMRSPPSRNSTSSFSLASSLQISTKHWLLTTRKDLNQDERIEYTRPKWS